jgi:predicted lipoprotein with Yx(FWY)xxD motif
MSSGSRIQKGDCMRNQIVFICIAIVVSALFVAGCTQPQTGVQTTQPTTALPASVQTTVVQTTAVQPSDTIKLVNSALGKILVDADGMTLYYFSTDIPGSGNSTCNGGCLAIWPVFNAGTITVSAPLSSSDFSTITRGDGKKQTTYKGYPLYYYRNDTKPGDTNGEGFLKIWFVVKPDSTVMIAQQKSLGLFLTDSNGYTLYYFTKDTSAASACNGTCSTLWPPFNATQLSIPTLINSTDFTSITRGDGMKQLAYKGRPLYTYSLDKKPGDANGQGFNNLWYVANVSGAMPVAVTPTATTKPPTTADDSSSGSSSSGGGY